MTIEEKLTYVLGCHEQQMELGDDSYSVCGKHQSLGVWEWPCAIYTEALERAKEVL